MKLNRIALTLIAGVAVTSGIVLASSDPMSVCQSLVYSSDQMSCLNAVMGKNFNPSAVSVCDGLIYGSDKIACLNRIANRAYDSTAVSVCARLNNGSDRINCLDAAADHSFNPNAVSICAGLYYSSAPVACLTKIADHYFDLSATSICGTLSYDDDRISCLTVTADKAFNPAAAQICANMHYSSDRIACLSRIGVSYTPPVYIPAPAPYPTYPSYPSNGSDPNSTPSCSRVVRNISDACGLSNYDASVIRSEALQCDWAESHSGKTGIDAVLLRNGRVLLAKDTASRGCSLSTLDFRVGGGVEQLNTVRGQGRSDKIFLRTASGQLFTLDMSGRAEEVMNAHGRSYELRSFRDVGGETVELSHRAGNSSFLSFDEIDQRRRASRQDEVLLNDIVVGALIGSVRYR